MRLRSSLILLCLATALPLAAFGLIAAAVVVQHEHQQLESAAKIRNRAAMSAMDSQVRGAISTLSTISVGQSLLSDDLAGFREVAVRALATQPSWVTIIVHDRDGRQLVNARMARDAVLPAKPVDGAAISQVVSTRAPHVGNLGRGPLEDTRPGIAVRVPVLRDGEVAYVLTGVIAPEGFQRVLAEQQLAEGWASGLVDSNGRLIARVPARPVGSPASKDYLAAIEGKREGWYRGLTLDGVETYTAFLKSDFTGWSLGYAVPVAIASSGARRAAWLMGAGIALSLVAAALIGYWLSRRISRPMSALADSAALIGAGKPLPAVRSAIHEVDQLSRALGEASRAIDLRDAELREQAGVLRRTDANKSQFLALLSHELRNPLAPLRNGLSLLRLRPDLKALSETHPMMERQVAHLARLIDDLLDVSRIDRGVIELRRERVDVDAVVRSAIETVRPVLDARRLQLSTTFAGEPLQVNGDPVRLSQVVSNLLNNAAKFAADDGGRIEVAVRREGSEAAISVRDDGIGFQEADGRRIFDMFVQLDTTRSRYTGGLGVGLTIVRSIVQMHGGRVRAHSDGPGHGAEFVVRLPALDAHDGTALATAAQPAPVRERGARRILVVDDNADAAESLARLLRVEGHEVRTAYDGIVAMGVAQEFLPEIAFVDLDMPGMTGLDLARALPREAGLEEVMLVALTGLGRKSDIDATREAGFHAHLTKPASAEDILRLAGNAPSNVIKLRGGRQSA